MERRAVVECTFLHLSYRAMSNSNTVVMCTFHLAAGCQDSANAVGFTVLAVGFTWRDVLSICHAMLCLHKVHAFVEAEAPSSN